jgi:hypothetical protein
VELSSQRGVGAGRQDLEHGLAGVLELDLCAPGEAHHNVAEIDALGLGDQMGIDRGDLLVLTADRGGAGSEERKQKGRREATHPTAFAVWGPPPASSSWRKPSYRCRK